MRARAVPTSAKTRNSLRQHPSAAHDRSLLNEWVLGSSTHLSWNFNWLDLVQFVQVTTAAGISQVKQPHHIWKAAFIAFLLIGQLLPSFSLLLQMLPGTWQGWGGVMIQVSYSWLRTQSLFLDILISYTSFYWLLLTVKQEASWIKVENNINI